MLDFPDRYAEDLSNFDRVEGVEDKASAVRWCNSRGWRVRLYQRKNPCSGSYRDLVGTGARNLESWSFGDKTPCAKWLAC